MNQLSEEMQLILFWVIITCLTGLTVNSVFIAQALRIIASPPM